MFGWLRRRFIAGFFVTVPLAVTVAAIVWTFRAVDSLTSGLYMDVLGRHVAGLGLLTTAAALLVIGIVATNVIGKRILARADSYLLRVPLFSTVYAPIKQLIVAFSPDNESGFKHVAMVESDGRLVLGFLTREFTVDRGAGPEAMVAVYVPTNHLYLGDIVICPAAKVSWPEIAVEDGLKIFLTGGMSLDPAIRAPRETHQWTP